MTVWKPLFDRNIGYLWSLSDALAITERKHPDLLTPVSNGALIVASDYSGQHKEATHEAYSFVVTTDVAIQAWLPLLDDFRVKWLPDNRRISYKKLSEPVRWRAMPAFFDLANQLSGNLVTILIDRRIGSMMKGGADAIADVFPECFPKPYNKGTVEKMFRLSSFVSFILAGLRHQDQSSFWISDHDEALDTPAKRNQFSTLAGYLMVGFTNWLEAADHIFATTEEKDLPHWAEDLASLADLAAGAYCHLNRSLPHTFEAVDFYRVRNIENKQDRALAITKWLARPDTALRHVLLRLEQDGQILRATAQAFLGND